ncbi:hypothetical protein ERJ75_001132300 [Trypanosoma vivax]|nr:hypothetical protein ERJ75_001132300 [Trypanosoma vivax]
MHTALRLVCFLALACGACSGTAPAGLAAGTALKMCTLTATLHDLARHAVIVAKEAARRHANVLANAALFEAAGLNCTGGSGNALKEACALQALVEEAKAPLHKAHDNAVDAAATLHRGAGMATEYISVLASFAGGGSGSGKACLLSTKTITAPGSNANHTGHPGRSHGHAQRKRKDMQQPFQAKGRARGTHQASRTGKAAKKHGKTGEPRREQ